MCRGGHHYFIRYIINLTEASKTRWRENWSQDGDVEHNWTQTLPERPQWGHWEFPLQEQDQALSVKWASYYIQMLKMHFSMARKFTLQPLRIYDVKPPEKTAQT